MSKINKSEEQEKAESNTTLDDQKTEKPDSKLAATKEVNGPKGLEPTRYGDWESKGRCYDF